MDKYRKIMISDAKMIRVANFSGGFVMVPEEDVLGKNGYLWGFLDGDKTYGYACVGSGSAIKHIIYKDNTVDVRPRV